MSVKKILALLLVFECLIGCKQNEFDAKFYGERYCKCFEDNFTKYGRLGTHKICDSVMIGENKFFRLYLKSFEDEKYVRIHLPKPLGDSVADFMRDFVHYLDLNCGNYFTDSIHKTK